ncbi:hypothetical protein ACK8P5_04925 [Paenibacillus sp. EC2-1]|uniref:hypothetical protein n=1 Tax=Paenibacillus sp. EC2-1 TaxID=3388665 RepID=UPI003BEF08DA
MRKKNLKVPLIILVSILLLLFAAWNIAWILLTNNRYEDFLKAVPKSKFGNHIIRKDDYVYGVNRPTYLSFTGNLSVNNSKEGKLLIIWPLMNGKYEYGIMIKKKDKVYQVHLNHDLTPIKKNSLIEQRIAEDLKLEVTELLKRAKLVWDLE